MPGFAEKTSASMYVLSVQLLTNTYLICLCDVSISDVIIHFHIPTVSKVTLVFIKGFCWLF